MLGGVLTTPPKNLTFSLRSCESDVKRYMNPISQKIGQKLDYACEVCIFKTVKFWEDKRGRNFEPFWDK